MDKPRSHRPPFVRALDRLIVAVGQLGRNWQTDRRRARVVTRPLGELIHHVCHAASLEDLPIADDDPILRDHHRAGYKAALEMMSALAAVAVRHWAPLDSIDKARTQTAIIVRAFEHRLADVERPAA